ncbi:MAG TPA: hypothetical protein VEI97_19010, partial [bacterium]|nr:hypothetical protein [bacterium]
MTGGSSDTLLGLFEVTVDPGGGATLSPAERTVQSSPQALSYDVDIQQFLSFHSLAIHGTGLDGDGNLVLEFIHRHPFTAPNFDLPVSGTNRADLGYTGRLVVLANTEQRRFFDGSITLDPYLVKDPDGYLHTGDLLHTGAERNNTFPYVLLVDEA